MQTYYRKEMMILDIKHKIYDDLSSILTMYEEGLANADDLYNILVEIQKNWEYITAE